MSKSGNDSLYFNFRDKYVVWDGINVEPFTEDTEDILRRQCSITFDGELLSVSEMLAIIHTNPLAVPIMIFSCKDGQTATEKEFDGKPRGVFSYFWCDLFRRDPKVTFRDAISLVNIDMCQEGLKQRAEVICRIDILDMPVMNVSLPKDVPCIMIMDMCRTEQTLADRKTLAEIKKAFKGSKSV